MDVIRLGGRLLVLLLPLQTPGQVTTVPELDPEYGWTWLVPPGPVVSEQKVSGITLTSERRSTGELKVRAVRNVDPAASALRYRLVAFAENGDRLEYTQATGSMFFGRATHEAIWPDADRVAFVGFEYLTADGQRKASERAMEEARRAGITPFSLPVVGQPYAFTAQTLDGKTVSSESWRGRVILIDFWASYCTPCMAKMGELKSLYGQYHDRGFEMLGVNLDFDRETCRKVAERHGLTWPQTWLPDDEAHRQALERATGVYAPPRLFLIDRDGTLSADCHPHELKSRIEALMAKTEESG